MNINNPNYWDDKWNKVSYSSQTFYKGHHKSLFDTIASKIPNNPGAILDIGCGNGSLLHAITPEQRKVYNGLDYSRVAIQNILKEWPGLKGRMIVGKCEDLSYYKYNYFDCIIISEVLEHLSEVQVIEVIDGCWRIMSLKGKLIITVPNGDDTKKSAKSFNIEHLRWYYTKSISELLNGYTTHIRIGTCGKNNCWIVMEGLKK